MCLQPQLAKVKDKLHLIVQHRSNSLKWEKQPTIFPFLRSLITQRPNIFFCYIYSTLFFIFLNFLLRFHISSHFKSKTCFADVDGDANRKLPVCVYREIVWTIVITEPFSDKRKWIEQSKCQSHFPVTMTELWQCLCAVQAVDED